MTNGSVSPIFGDYEVAPNPLTAAQILTAMLTQVLNTPRVLDAVADNAMLINDALWCRGDGGGQATRAGQHDQL